MKQSSVLTQDSFEALLAWLHTDRDQAGTKYEYIRQRLIKIFECRGCLYPEELADETINRVAKKLKEIVCTFDGDPARYFFGVASKVYLESLRPKKVLPPPMSEISTELEHQYRCLDQCMEKLTASNRTLVLEYYQEDKRTMIDHRKQLADQLGIAINALRIRAHRIRATLEECMESCLENETS